MKTRTYQIALVTAAAVCLALAAALVYVLLPRFDAAPQGAAQDPVVARGPSASENAARQGRNSPSAAEPTLTPVQLSPQRMQEIGVTTASVVYRDLSDDLEVPGNVDIDEEKLAYVQTRFPGWIQQVFANATYQYVHKGQRLFTVYSPDLVSTEQEFLLARQNQKAFVSDAHGMAAREGDWLLNAAEERLRQFGIPAQAIVDLQKTGKVQRNIAIDSPVSGFITERNALPNAYVQPETKLYTIADLSTIWVYANVFQSDVGRLKPGNRAQVTVDAYPGRHFNGRVDQILPQVDPTTRTVRVRLIFSNPGVVLKPGMYVNVDIQAPLGRQLVIPASAVLQTGSRAIAFVDHGGGYLEPRTVTTGPQVDNSVVVLSGLKAGEKVVSSANFLVDSEAQLQAAAGGFAPPPPQPTAKENPQSAEQVHIDFSTSPSPPRKGANTLRVQLTGTDGKPFSGAQTAAVFFMPAMPAMGMPAMRATASLAEKSAGLFEGKVQLGSGGTWQANVTVRKGGQVIATKQFSVDATGGMG